MSGLLSQFYPPKPTFTPEDIPSQAGKVFIITGANSGVGYELAKILYPTGATIYLACRSQETTEAAIKQIKSSSSIQAEQAAKLHYLRLDLSDLASIKASVNEFLSKEQKLHILWNNAGISQPPAGLKSAQGYEIQIATNCLGPYLFTQLLLPALRAAATDNAVSPGSIRVVWSGSMMIDVMAPKGGFEMSSVRNPVSDNSTNYTLSKTGNYFLGCELARQVQVDGILSITQNPGNLKTNILKHAPKWMSWSANWWLWPAKKGAFTGLYSGLSPELTLEKDQGAYILPWGRKQETLKADLKKATLRVEENGTGRAKEFWDWCDDVVSEYK